MTKITDLNQLQGEQCLQDADQTAATKDRFARLGSRFDALGGGTGDVSFAHVCARLSWNVSRRNARYAAQLAPLLPPATAHDLLAAWTECHQYGSVVSPGLLHGAASAYAHFHLPGERQQAASRQYSHLRGRNCDTIGDHFRSSSRIFSSLHQSCLRPQDRPSNLDSGILVPDDARARPLRGPLRET